jgi:hypothetical protein
MRNAVLVVIAVAFVFSVDVEDCDAQLFRRMRATAAQKTPEVAPPLWKQSAGHIGSYVPQNLAAAPKFPVDDYFTPRRPKISMLLDGPMTHKYRNPAEVDSRYIGGFHQSHFQNIGIPSGDIGLRGNAYNWRTW